MPLNFTTLMNKQPRIKLRHALSKRDLSHLCDSLLKSLTLSQMTNFGLFQTERVCRRLF